MGYQAYPPPSTGPKPLNKSQVFVSSGTWTVPANVTYAHYVVRGGDGTQPTLGYGGTNGVNGGNSSVGSLNAYGGKGGLTYYSEGNYGYSWAAGAAGQSGTTAEGFFNVTPGASVTVTIGSGVGSYATISWGE